MYNDLVLDHVNVLLALRTTNVFIVSNYLLYWPFRSNNFVTLMFESAM